MLQHNELRCVVAAGLEGHVTLQLQLGIAGHA